MSSGKVIRKLPFMITAIINVILLFLVYLLMNQVKHLLDSDVKINLTEIVTQNKDVITSRLTLEMNNLSIVSKQISDRYQKAQGSDSEDLEEAFLAYAAENKEEEIFIATEKGLALFPDGEKIDISGRNYFRLSIKGIQNISERTVSRKDGEDIFVISSPIICEDKAIGTVQKQYTSQQIYDICAISLFFEKGYIQIINSQGYVLIDSRNGYILESDNYFRQLYLDNPEESRRLEQDIRAGKPGFMETMSNGVKYFSAYTPVEEVYDWYLISSVVTDAVSPNAAIVIQLFYGILTIVVLVFGGSIFYILILKNRQESKIRRFAFVDPITDGDTFARFQYDLEPVLKNTNIEPLYLLSLDIDNFKYINNFYGFDTGDRILKHIYSLYYARLEQGEFIARVHNDHFILLLRDGNKGRLEALFELEINFEGIMIYFSAGLYQIYDREESISLMVDKANTAKQKVKGIRYKCIETYTEAFSQKMIFDEQMKRSVEQALAADEIIPYFQPKVNIHTRKLVGAEALARWRKRDGTLISPGEFIPVCEETGLIISVDLTIFEKTLQFIKANLDAGILCTPISVNFSRLHFLNKDFLQVILEKMEQYQIPPELIEIEITETAIFDNYQLMEDFIRQLHSHGLKISMDDFGSGYSSLHMLKDIPIDVLKIDRGFLLSTEDSMKQRSVFAAIAQMAKGLEIKVVVEGVENLDHVGLMKEFDCSIAQGFYYSRPIPQDEFEMIYRGGDV